ncbi:hypothetical protein GCM10009678_68330 [Actinomadura kijaniata]
MHLSSTIVASFVAAVSTTGATVTGTIPTMVVYEKTGGFAGVSDRVTVDHTGTVVTRDGTFELAPVEVGELRRALDRITTTASSAQGCDIPDHFSYTLSYDGWRATRCHRVPPDWMPAVMRLAALAERPG